MDLHPLKEENELLKFQLQQTEEKLRKLADLVEKRNNQVKQYSDMYEQLKQQFEKAQETSNALAQSVDEKDETIAKLSEFIDELRFRQLKLSKENGKEAAFMRDDLERQHMHFIETLNKLSTAKAPAEEAFWKMSELLERKNKEINELKDQYDQLTNNLDLLNQDSKKKDDEISNLKQENNNLKSENDKLKKLYYDAKTGREELNEIENLKLEVDKARDAMHTAFREVKSRKKKNDELKDKVKQLNQKLNENDITIKEFQDRIISEMDRVQEKIKENDAIQLKCSNLQKQLIAIDNKCKTMESSYNNLQKENKMLLDQKKSSDQQRNKDLITNMKNKRKIDLVKAKLKEEMNKRLLAEEDNISAKEKMLQMTKEVAILKKQLDESKLTNLDPLVALIKDLRSEIIAIEDDYQLLLKSVPQTDQTKVKIPDVPKGICESISSLMSQAISTAITYQIENKELRIVNHKLARVASIYHQISNVLSNYPILTKEDTSKPSEVGNWILPMDIQHLQKTVIRLHDILTQKKNISS